MGVAIGCRDHSGWAVLVAVGGDSAAPEILARQRVELIDDGLPRMAYHAALDMDLKAATRLLAQVEASATRCATHVLDDLVERLRGEEHHVAGLGVAASTTSLPSKLSAILASHALVHAAEGELYREVLADAATGLGLSVTRFPNKRAITEAAAATGVDPDALSTRLAGLRKPLGPPWQKDHREATAAALLVLAS